MPVRYVWWDDPRRRETRRVEVPRMPAAMHDVLKETAKAHGVSVAQMIVGCCEYTLDPDRRPSLKVEVRNTVRLSERLPDAGSGLGT